MHAQLRTIHLHGSLKEFGESYKLSVVTAGEAVRALCMQIKGLKEAIEAGSWHVIRGSLDSGIQLDAKECSEFKLGKGDLHIVPAVEGAKSGGGGGAIKIVLGVALIGAALFFAPAAGGLSAGIGSMGLTYGHLALVGAALVLAGVASLISPNEEAEETEEEKSSYLLNGPGPTYEQGGPIPIIYGEVYFSGVTISAGLDIDGNGSSTTRSSLNWTGFDGTDEHYKNVSLLLKFAGKQFQSDFNDMSPYRFSITDTTPADKQTTRRGVFIEAEEPLKFEQSARFNQYGFIYSDHSSVNPINTEFDDETDLPSDADGLEVASFYNKAYTIETSLGRYYPQVHADAGVNYTDPVNPMYIFQYIADGSEEMRIVFENGDYKVIYANGDTIATTGNNKLFSNVDLWDVAVIRNGNNVRLFLQGTVVASGTTSFQHTDPSAVKYAVGGDYFSQGYSLSAPNRYVGLMDELRVTTGVNRYTSNNYTPLTQGSPTSQSQSQFSWSD